MNRDGTPLQIVQMDGTRVLPIFFFVTLFYNFFVPLPFLVDIIFLVRSEIAIDYFEPKLIVISFRLPSLMSLTSFEHHRMFLVVL